MGEPALDRRAFMAGLAASGIAGALPAAAQSDAPFTFESVVALARARAESDFDDSRQTPAGPFADLDYDGYRAIRFRPERRLWTGEGRGFTIDLLPPGSIYADAVRISTVSDGVAIPVPFDPTVFEFDPARFTLLEGGLRTEDGAGMA